MSLPQAAIRTEGNLLPHAVIRGTPPLILHAYTLKLPFAGMMPYSTIYDPGQCNGLERHK